MKDREKLRAASKGYGKLDKSFDTHRTSSKYSRNIIFYVGSTRAIVGASRTGFYLFSLSSVHTTNSNISDEKKIIIPVYCS
jgi:hypothetical protein